MMSIFNDTSLGCIFLLVFGFSFIKSAIHHEKVILISFGGLTSDFVDFADEANIEISAFMQTMHSGCYERKVSLLNVSSETQGHSIVISGQHIDEIPPLLNEDDYCDNFLMWKVKNSSQTLWSTNQLHGFHSESFFWPDDYIGINRAEEFRSIGVTPSSTELAFGIQRIMNWISSPNVNFISVFVPATSTELVNFNSFFRETIHSANTFLAHLLRYVRNDKSLYSTVNFVIIGGINPRPSSLESIAVEDNFDNMKILKSYLSTSRVLEAWSFRNEETRNLTETPFYKVCNTTAFRNRHPDLKAGILPPFFLIAKPKYNLLVRKYPKNTGAASKSAFILTSGPSFKSDSCKINSTGIFQLVDVYPLLCWVLGLDKPFQHDGSLKRVQHLLRNPPSIEQLAAFTEYASGRRSHSSPTLMTLNTMALSISVSLFAVILAAVFSIFALRYACRRDLQTRRRKRRQGYSVIGQRKNQNEFENHLLGSSLPEISDEDVLMVNQSASKSSSDSLELVQMLHGPLESGRSRLSLPEGLTPSTC